MKIRITGTAAELQAITELMKGKDYVRSISQPYKNRGEYSKDYRLYVETYDLQPEQLTQIRAAEVKQIREPEQTEQGGTAVNIPAAAYKKLMELQQNAYNYQGKTIEEILTDIINKASIVTDGIIPF